MIKLTDVGDTKQSSLLMKQYLIKELYTYYNKRDESASKINSDNYFFYYSLNLNTVDHSKVSCKEVLTISEKLLKTL